MKKNIILFIVISIFVSCSSSNEENENIINPTKLISIEINQLDFPETPREKESNIEIKVLNNGDGDIKISNYSITDGFEISNIENIISKPLSPGEHYLSITFKPKKIGNYEGELILFNDSSNNSELRLKLNGTATPSKYTREGTTYITNQNTVDFLSAFDEVNLEELIIAESENETSPILNINGLSNIKTLKSLTIFETKNSFSFEALSNTEITELLSIIDRKDENLELYKVLFRENISYNILRNKQLTDLNAFQSIKNINILVLSSNPLIIDLNDFANINIIKYIQIDNNINLENFCGINQSAYSIPTSIRDNKFNPQKEDFIAGKCRLN